MRPLPVTVESSFPSPSEEDWREAEARAGAGLPPELRALLSEHNAGRFVATVFGQSDLGLEQFLGVGDVPDHADLVAVIDRLGERLPRGLVPFARDGMGNLYLVDSESPGAPVLFWDHEWDGGDVPAVSRVADSLDAFLAGLRVVSEAEDADAAIEFHDVWVDPALAERIRRGEV